MDKLVQVMESELTIEFALRAKCRTTIHLRNLMHTMHVAFKVQSTSPHKFTVKPPNGFIPPMGDCTLEVNLLSQDHLPELFPRSNDLFFVKSAMAPGGPSTDRVPSQWFVSRKKHVFLDAKLPVVYVGSFLLRHLVAQGELNDVEFLLRRDHGAHNQQDNSGRTVLHMAAASGNVQMVGALLEAGAEVDAVSHGGQTPLLEAVYAGHSDAATSLLERGADPEAGNSATGWTAIHLAASLNRWEMVRLLIEKGGQLDAKDSEGRTPLHCAVAAGLGECVKVLLEAGADKDAQSLDGSSPVYRAASRGDGALVELLVEWGASRSIRTLEGKSPYDIAAEKGHVAVLKALELGDGLLSAARRGDLDIVRKYLSKGAQVNMADQYGWTPLHCAAFKGHSEVAVELLTHGADVHSRDLEGHTALHCAVETGHKELVQLLIAKGADVNAKSVRGATPVNIAAALQYGGVLRYLLTQGCEKTLFQVAPEGCVPHGSAKFQRDRPTSLVYVQ